MERNTEPKDENQVPYNQSVTEPPQLLYFSSNTQDNEHLHRLISTLLVPANKYKNVIITYVSHVLNMRSKPWIVWTESHTIN